MSETPLYIECYNYVYVSTKYFLLVSEEPLDTTLTSASCPEKWFDGDVESMETTDCTGEFDIIK